MTKDDAKDLLDLFYRRTKSTGLLTDEQRGSVLTTIMKTYDDAAEVTISDVRRIVEKEVAPNAPRKIEMPSATVNEFEQQTVEEQTGILGDAFKTLLQQFPYLQQPFIYDQAGKVVGPASRDAYDTVLKLVKHWSSRFGTKKMTVGRVVDAVCYLDLHGLWPRKEVVVVEKPAPPPPTENDINNQRREKEKRMNTEGDSAIRGARTVEKVKATREELEKAATDATAEAAAAATITAMIHNHKGKSHGASAAESKLLAQLFESARAEGKSFQEVQGLIVAKKAEMSTWDAQRAIREVYAPVAKAKGLSLDKTPGKFQPEKY